MKTGNGVNYSFLQWKTCLSHLAELDFEVKDAERHMKDESEVSVFQVIILSVHGTVDVAVLHYGLA